MPIAPAVARRLVAALCLVAGLPGSAAGQFTMEQVKSYPYPNELAAAATGSRIAWAFNEQGLRNLWVAEGPRFQPRQLTRYTADDGQELSRVELSADGRWVVYMRGGDQANWDSYVPVNPAFSPVPPTVACGRCRSMGASRSCWRTAERRSRRCRRARRRAVWRATSRRSAPPTPAGP
jgi:hypothetical protein